MRRLCWSVFALLLCLPALPTFAQDSPTTSPPVKTAKPKSKATTTKKTTSKSKSANLKTGTITAIDAESVSLNERTATNTYTLTDKTRFRKNKNDADLDAFKVGDQVSLKLRKVRGQDAYTVAELQDIASAEQMDAIRHKQMQATIQKIEEGELSVTFGSESEPFTYTTSEKTLWSRAGKDAQSSDFKVGDVVTIAPRSLPSGNVMAAIVADNAQDVTGTKARHSRTVTGKISLLDTEKGQIVLIVTPQETREFTYSPQTIVLIGSRPATAASLKLGQRIRASLKQMDNDLYEASRITIETKKTTTSKKALTKKGEVITGTRVVVPRKK